MNSSTKDTYVKHNPGKSILLFLFLLMSLLRAEDLSYTFNVSNESPYVKEAVIMTLDLNQTNHDIVLLLNFDLKKSPDYAFQRLDVKETDTHHDARVHYTYIIYPLKAGVVNLHFDLTKKVTTDESVAYSFSGDRDNVKGLVSKDSKVTLPPLTLEVKSLPEGTDIVGDFTLKQTFNTHKVQAYEPIPFNLTIGGEGYTPLVPDIIPKELNVSTFKETPIVKTIHSHAGTKSTVIYPMALSHKESFDLPPIVIQGFNPKTEKSYNLTVKGQHFDIEKADTSTLLDKVDNPEPFSMDWSWLQTLLSYLLVFTAGYFTAMTLKWQKKRTETEADPLIEKIASVKEPKALLQLLIATDSKKFVVLIEKLENGLYKKGKINFKALKTEAMETV